jgi:hypothetical protein
MASQQASSSRPLTSQRVATSLDGKSVSGIQPVICGCKRCEFGILR